MKGVSKFLVAVLLVLTVFMTASCDNEEHTHTLTKVEAKAATCETAGNSEYYTCDCGKYFSNADGTTEITKDSWVISATGHSYSNEWTYNETHHWKVAICEHTTEKSEYAEHTLTNNECTCGYAVSPSIELEGKTFNFVSIDTQIPGITFNSGSLVFKADNVIELFFNFTVPMSDSTATIESSAVGTYELNEEGFLYTLTGVYDDGIYSAYPEEIAPEYANLQGIVNGNTIVISSWYSTPTQTGIAYMTFVLAE